MTPQTTLSIATTDTPGMVMVTLDMQITGGQRLLVQLLQDQTPRTVPQIQAEQFRLVRLILDGMDPPADR